MTAYRVKGRGRVDHDAPVTFMVDGRSYQGLRGDTLASALLANGVHLMGRSFKYHRPRGVMTAGPEEPNALFGTSRGPGRREPNTRATVQEIRQGLVAETQNRLPSVRFDIGAINDLLHVFLPAGFYYKTFMWPRGFWDKVYEPAIRAVAGLGKAPLEDDPDSYASRFLHCDVLVIGGGPAGLQAAHAAASAGADVTLVDEGPEFGGALLSDPGVQIDRQGAWTWLGRRLAELEGMGVRLLSRTTAFGYYHQNMVGLCERLTDHLDTQPPGMPRERLWRVRAGQVVLTQGAIEKPLVFDGNDRPGIMLAGAAQSYLNRYGVRVGDRAVVATSHDSAYFTAFDLIEGGAAVAAIIDTRAAPGRHVTEEARRRGIEVLASHTVSGTSGRLRISGVTVNPVENGWVGAGRRIGCDCLLMSGGWTPSLHLFSHTNGALIWDEAAGTYLPGKTREACHVAGAGRGLWGYQAALADGNEAGLAAARAAGFDGASEAPAITGDRQGNGETVKELTSAGDRKFARAFVDFQNDVTAKDIRLAVREGMQSIEHVKRYTTNGMATDQGKLSNINALMIAAEAVGRPPPEVGLTTFRPPYTPTTFGVLAGYHRGGHFDATRKTPIDGWAEEQGAVFEPVGQWRRARYFPQTGEGMDDAVARECLAVRKRVGIFDASTLGKLELVGPDAVMFLDRMYTNAWGSLAAGRCRYGLLLGEDGFIRDDGIIARIAEERFHITTTTGGAQRVHAMMEDYLQTEWPDLKAWLTSVTEQWAVIALNGPDARSLLEPLVDGLDISREAFPHMSCADCHIAGLPVRLWRVSFAGELGFEINVPARHGRALWERLIEAGRPHGIAPYGTEAMHVLRAEKGFIIVGQETDGTVTPDDAGLGWAIGKRKHDFVGMRSLRRPDIVATDRKQLVGLLTADGGAKLEEGAQIVADPSEPIPMRMIGHVTSSYFSPILERPIALALVEGGRDRIGDTLHVPMPGAVRRVTVCPPVFYDPDGARTRM